MGQPAGRQVLKHFVCFVRTATMPACHCDTDHKESATPRDLSQSEKSFSGQFWATWSCGVFSLPPPSSSLLLGKTSSSEDPLLRFVLFSLPLVLVPQLFPICMFIVWKQTRFPALSPNTSFQKVYLSGTWRMWFQLQPCQQMSCRQLLLTPLLSALQYILRHSREGRNQA